MDDVDTINDIFKIARPILTRTWTMYLLAQVSGLNGKDSTAKYLSFSDTQIGFNLDGNCEGMTQSDVTQKVWEESDILVEDNSHSFLVVRSQIEWEHGVRLAGRGWLEFLMLCHELSRG